MTAYIKRHSDGWGVLYPDPGSRFEDEPKLITSTQRFKYMLDAFDEARAMGYTSVEKWVPKPKGKDAESST